MILLYTWEKLRLQDFIENYIYLDILSLFRRTILKSLHDKKDRLTTLDPKESFPMLLRHEGPTVPMRLLEKNQNHIRYDQSQTQKL